MSKPKTEKKKRLTSAERKSRDEAIAAEKAFIERKKAHDEKVAGIQQEAKELEDMRRAQIMRVVTGINLTTAELDVFVRAFLERDHKLLTEVLIKYALEAGTVINMDNFQTKLVRMGLL